ncbi:MAG: hypothetical protein ACREHD_17100 [Pirellulales bacterium]
MPSYDAALFHPPAPVARVVLRDPSSGQSAADVLMLIDCGADVTLLPRSSLEGLGVDTAAGEEYELTAFDGTTSMSRAVDMHLLFLRRTFRGRFLMTDDECGVLGRDILNHLSILLNGPKLEWSDS